MQQIKYNGKRSEITRTLRIANICLIVGAIAILISPWLFTRDWFDIITFDNKTGPIGDTIGGITAPIANLLGAILVYFALKAQIKANEIIQDQIDKQDEKEAQVRDNEQLHHLYDHLDKNISNYKFSTLDKFDIGTENITTCNGSSGIYKFFIELRCNYHGTEEELLENPCVTELLGILKICNMILKKAKISNATDKELIKTMTTHQFEYKIMPALRGVAPEDLEVHYCESCGNNHGIPKLLLDEIKSIEIEMK